MSKKSQGEARVKKNAFVHKLYTMLSDPSLDNLIWWSNNNPENNTFALYPGKEFADCLTRYFKHGNVASFVRQLHMYGFHKVSDAHHHHQQQLQNQLKYNPMNIAGLNNNGPLEHGANPGGYFVGDNSANTDLIDKDVPPIWEFKHLSGKFRKEMKVR